MMVNSSKCLVHMVNKIQLICLKKQCKHKLQCWRCHYQENKHHSQLVEKTIVFNKIEDKQIFIQIVNKCIEQCDNNEQFKQMLKQKVMEEMIDKRQNLKIMSKVMADQSQQTINQWMNNINNKMDGQQYENINEIKNNMMDEIKIDNESQYEQKESDISEIIKQNKQLEKKIKELQKEMKEQLKDKEKQISILIENNKDLIEIISKIQQQHQEQLDVKDIKINELIKQNQDFKQKIKKQYQEIKKQLKNVKKDVRGLNGEGQDIKGLIKRQQYELKQEVEKKYQQLIESIKQPIDNNKIDSVYQLKQCKNVVHISDYDEVDDYRKQIEEYQQDDKQYKIVVNFGSVVSGFYSIDNKMGMLRMIDTVNTNSKVRIVYIELNSSNRWNSEIVGLMIDRYTNVYAIYVDDLNDSVDDQMYGLIKQYVQQQPVMIFELLFYGSLVDNDDGYELMEQYNQLIKQKQYLEWVGYRHHRISGWKSANTEQEIKQLIKKVDR